jgi:hypothetical protein
MSAASMLKLMTSSAVLPGMALASSVVEPSRNSTSVGLPSDFDDQRREVDVGGTEGDQPGGNVPGQDDFRVVARAVGDVQDARDDLDRVAHRDRRAQHVGADGANAGQDVDDRAIARGQVADWALVGREVVDHDQDRRSAGHRRQGGQASGEQNF